MELVCIGMMAFGAVFSATAFTVGGIIANKLTGRDPKAEREETKRHNKAMEKFDAGNEAYRRAREELADWEEEQEMIRQQDLDDMTATNRALYLYAKMNPRPYVPPKPQWNAYYRPSSSQRMVEMIYVGVGCLQPRMQQADGCDFRKQILNKN